jgi:hypothetical protein
MHVRVVFHRESFRWPRNKVGGALAIGKKLQRRIKVEESSEAVDVSAFRRNESM